VSDQAPSETPGEPRLAQTLSAGVSAPPAAVDDADDLRGFHFRRLLAKRSTRIWIGIGVVAGAAIGGASLGLIFGLFGALAALVIGALIVYSMASSASEQAFFKTYAEQRQMSIDPADSLPEATPLLRKGDERHADEVLSGPLGDGVDGTLALYTYTDVYYDKNGRHESDYHFTVAMTEIPACVQLVPELYCNRKSGFRFMEGVEDAFRSMERVHLESDSLEDHYEIFVSKNQDQNWIRQLFSPTFIVWLTDSAPEKFAFELDAGVLCCNVKGHKKDAAHLDELRATATSVAQRISEEVGE
jgi:hypothetical protein